jgi:tRNA A37 threonylcarbamoyladenosine dehydratase
VFAQETSQYEARFAGVGRLFGKSALETLRRSHVCVVGVGGVGSWAVEALARSGVGRLTLIDLDDVCVSNTNRQLPALLEEIGKPKVEVLARRVRSINPECAVRALSEFFTAATAGSLLEEKYDFVLDAIDNVANKCLLLAECHRRGIPVLATGAAGGRRDPTAVRISDLARSTHDRLLFQVRKELRAAYGFPAASTAPFGIECVYSPEPVQYPRPEGTVCPTNTPGTALRLNCESGYGTAAFVTGAFGFAAAGRIVQRLAEQGAE